MTAQKPTIVKVIKAELEEREPPTETGYEFIETFPKQRTPTGAEKQAGGNAP